MIHPRPTDVAHMLNTPAPKARYVYSVISIHLPYCDEVSVGVIVGSDESNDWRSRLLSSEFNGFASHPMQDDWDGHHGEKKLMQMNREHVGEVLRYSYPESVIANGAQEALDIIWPTLISQVAEDETKRLFG